MQMTDRLYICVAVLPTTTQVHQAAQGAPCKTPRSCQPATNADAQPLHFNVMSESSWRINRLTVCATDQLGHIASHLDSLTMSTTSTGSPLSGRSTQKPPAACFA
jgi:hypothetical protein